MSDEAVDARETLESALTAQFQEMDKAETPPAPEAATAKETVSEPTPATPEPVVKQDAPKAVAHADTDLVIDPLDGKEKKWGEIKAERLRQADYTKKTMALAEERRRVAEYEANLKAQVAQAALANTPKLQDLPEDDPYAQHLAAQNRRLQAIQEHQEAMAAQAKIAEERIAERELEASRMALDAKEKQLAADHGLNKREIELVEREYYFRSNAGEQVQLDEIAKEHAAWKVSLKEEAVNEFKTKHRVDTPAAGVSVPAVGTTKDEPPPPHTRARANYLRDLLLGAQ